MIEVMYNHPFSKKSILLLLKLNILYKSLELFAIQFDNFRQSHLERQNQIYITLILFMCWNVSDCLLL